MADATAIITFRTVLQPDFFISSTPPFYVILIYAVGSSTMSPSPPFSDSLPSSAALISMNNFVEAMRTSLYNGQSVNIRDFGVFSLSARTKGVDTEKECTSIASVFRGSFLAIFLYGTAIV